MLKNRERGGGGTEMMVSCDFTTFLLSAEDDTSFFIIIFPLGVFLSNKEYITQRKCFMSFQIHLYWLK